VLVDEDIATLYVDGVALNARMYAKAGSGLAVQVVDGELDVVSATVRTVAAQD